MKFFNNKIRVRAETSVIERTSTPHSSPEINPYHHIETPREFSFSNERPWVIKPVQGNNNSLFAGVSGAVFHYDRNNNKTGVAKESNDAEHIKEPLFYHFAKQFAPDIALPTVARNHESINGVLKPHSVQQYVNSHKDFIKKNKGFIHLPTDLNNTNYEKEYQNENSPIDYSQHPDLIKIGLLDYLMRNADRNSSNFIVSKDNKIHPIDNSYIFSPRHDNPLERWQIPLLRKKFVDKFQNIPDDIRDNFSKVNPHEAVNNAFNPIINHYEKSQRNIQKGIMENRKNETLGRLQTLQKHLKNPNIRNVNDLKEALYH